MNTNGLGLGIFGAGTVGSAAYLYNEHLDRQAATTANTELASRIPLTQPEEEEQEEEETNLHEIFNSYRDF